MFGGAVVMRITVAAAVACLIGSVAIADSARAAVRRTTAIPAQDLKSALQSLATEREFQILYRTEVVGDRQTAGASGELNMDEALTRLLSGTGLAYQYLDDKTITITPLGAASRADAAKASAAPTSTADESAAKGGEKPSFWSRFRLAEVDQGAAVSSATDARPNPDNPQALSLEEVVVTAQKREERLKDVPISISVLSGAELDHSRVVGVTEALNSVPGVVATASNQSGGTQVAVRGVGASSALFTGSSPIAYYLDSVPFGLVKTAIVPDTNAFDLERIEVLRGPQGTLYGASAQGGVVRILTHDADLDGFDLKLRTSASETQDGGGNYRGDMAINVPVVPGKLAARAVIGYENLSGWFDNAVRKDSNDAELRNFRLKINAQPTESLSLGLSAWRSRDDYSGPSDSDDSGRRPSAALPEPITTDFDAYGFKLGYELPLFSVTSMSSYLDYANESQLDLTSGGLPGTALFTGFAAHVFSQEVLLNSARESAWRWSAGAFYRDASDRLQQKISTFFGVNWQHGSKSYATFGELGRRFHDSQLEWTLGLRYFHDDVFARQNTLNVGQPPQPLANFTDTFNSTTPRAVLSWFPTSNLTLYASYSEGFRSGAPQDPGVNYPPAKPDKLHNYEIGAKGDALEGHVSFDTAVYYLDWRDVQQVLGVPIGDVCCGGALVNGKSASGPGIDLAMTFRPLGGLQLGVNLGWNDLTLDSEVLSTNVVLFEKGDRLNSSSRYTAGVWADYAFPIGSLSGRFSASANYSSKQSYRTETLGTIRVQTGDNWSIARAGFSVSSEDRWTATLFIDNLNNEKAALYPTPFFTPEWAPRARPRTTGLQFEYHL